MTTVDYRQLGLDTYGHACELCGFRAIVEIHHLAYNLHNEWEKRIRLAKKLNASNYEDLLEQAKELGYLTFEYNQLDKDNRSTNLSVLCPNCHSLVHLVDMDMSLLKALPPRR
jgi:hypothetical protein